MIYSIVERNVADAMRECEMYFDSMIKYSAVLHPELVTDLLRLGDVRRGEGW